MNFGLTKIIATLGPAASTKKMLKKIVTKGVDAVRINTAHGSSQDYNSLVKAMRIVSPEMPVIVDLKGPEVRFRTKEPLKVLRGQNLEVGFSVGHGAYFSRDFYSRDIVGKRVFFEDGKFSAKIVSKSKGKLVLKFISNSQLADNKGVNLPDVNLGLPFLSSKDLKIIKWARKKRLRFFALSFAKSGADLKALRKKTGPSSVLIAKIESREGVKNFDSVLKEADGVIIARGDLGAEVKRESIPLLQKRMIRKAINAGKFSVVATQMLESMIDKPYPTRAEINDIANSVLDGADCLMLSGETAIGVDPAAAVAEMRRASEEVEEKVPNLVTMVFRDDVSDSITKSIFQLSSYLKVRRVIAFTKSGYTASMMSRFRSPLPVLALTWDARTVGLLKFFFGVFPVLLTKKVDMNSRKVLSLLKKKGFIKKGDSVILTGNMHSGREQHANLIEIQEVK